MFAQLWYNKNVPLTAHNKDIPLTADNKDEISDIIIDYVPICIRVTMRKLKSLVCEFLVNRYFWYTLGRPALDMFRKE